MTRQTSHAIADIVFTDDWSALICQCGEDVHALGQDDLNAAFQDHRAASGEARRAGTNELIGNMGESEFYRRQVPVGLYARQR